MQDLAAQALEQVGLGGREQSNYLCLSEGQKQLCILARTLVSGSRLLLLDEPESALEFSIPPPDVQSAEGMGRTGEARGGGHLA